MNINVDKLDWKSFGAFLKSTAPRGGIHPLDAFPASSRLHILEKIHRFANEATGPEGGPFPVQLPKHLHDALEDARRLVGEGRGAEGGDRLQRRVGEA